MVERSLAAVRVAPPLFELREFAPPQIPDNAALLKLQTKWTSVSRLVARDTIHSR
jgi:hypothetical protein